MAILCISNANLVSELKLPLAPPPLVDGGPPLPCRWGPPPRHGGPSRLGGPLTRPPFLLLRFSLPLGKGGVGEGEGVGEGLRDLELLPLDSPASFCIGYSMVSSLDFFASIFHTGH